MVKDFVHQSSYDHSWSSCTRAYFLRYPNPNASHVLSVDVLDRRIEYRPVRGPSSSASSSSVTLDDLDHPSTQRDTIPVLCTTRLILKRGNLPKWAPSGLIKNAESWVMEESEVELDLFPPRVKSTEAPVETTPTMSTAATSLKGRTKNGRAMRSWTRNLDHTTVLAVTEGLVFKERFGFMSPDDEAGHQKGRSGASEHTIWRSYCKTLTTAQIESQINFGMLRRRIEKFGLARFVAHKDTSQQGIMWTRSQLGDGDAEQASSPQPEQGVLQRSSMPQKRIKLLESLRPPFLDGYPLGPWQKIKMWWYSGHYSQVKELRDGYLIERDEDEDEASSSERRSSRKALEGSSSTHGEVDAHDAESMQPQMRFRGAEQEGPWAELSGRKGKGAVYSDQDRNVEEGVLNRVRAQFGLPLLQPPSSHEPRQGIFARAMERARIKAKSLLGFDDDEMHAKQQTQGRLERIDRNRTV
ncbi:related to UPS1 - mitochondrial intermembrane space protein that regulates mitochondrial cardiolipin levels [Ustilago trichophora]|uniref:Related to UPS1 - mitochondrial intermembrane space protein that regulates mitochondrial cardiolipin levels n=1 Tax=Ustilago trichophora TaxID=86804 RepID=A0A5C3DZA2_9BASI|nr:related to UPS1 - mitochondrial intermembrane space protein that regulates mitochondrial cardiolipin levels [Ustilago trichophora]